MGSKVKPPVEGPYDRRANVLYEALAPKIEKEFGKASRAQQRNTGQNLVYTWQLPHKVEVKLCKSAGAADPAIWIYRNDPHGKPHPEGDWSNNPIYRDSADKTFCIDAIVQLIANAVAHNRMQGDAYAANMKVIGEELKGVTLPPGIQISRDEKSGNYTIRHSFSAVDVDRGTTIKIVQTIHMLESCAQPEEESTEPAAAAAASGEEKPGEAAS